MAMERVSTDMGHHSCCSDRCYKRSFKRTRMMPAIECFVTEARQQQLIELAESGFPANAVRGAIRDTLTAIEKGYPTEAVSDSQSGLKVIG